MLDWVKARTIERTSWDGAALIGTGLVILLLGPFAKWAAYAAIVWGAWTILTKEDQKMV